MDVHPTTERVSEHGPGSEKGVVNVGVVVDGGGTEGEALEPSERARGFHYRNVNRNRLTPTSLPGSVDGKGLEALTHQQQPGLGF